MDEQIVKIHVENALVDHGVTEALLSTLRVHDDTVLHDNGTLFANYKFKELNRETTFNFADTAMMKPMYHKVDKRKGDKQQTYYMASLRPYLNKLAMPCLYLDNTIHSDVLRDMLVNRVHRLPSGHEFVFDVSKTDPYSDGEEIATAQWHRLVYKDVETAREYAARVVPLRIHVPKFLSQ